MLNERRWFSVRDRCLSLWPGLAPLAPRTLVDLWLNMSIEGRSKDFVRLVDAFVALLACAVFGVWTGPGVGAGVDVDAAIAVAVAECAERFFRASGSSSSS